MQLLLMPMLVPALGEEKLLSIGLFFSCVHVSTLSLCSYSLFLTFIMTRELVLLSIVCICQVLIK